MDSHQIIELLARKMAGEATPAELKKLDELMAKYPDSIYYEEILKELWLESATHNAGQPDIDEIYIRHQLKFKQDLGLFEDAAPVSGYGSYRSLSVIVLSLIILFLIGFSFWGKKNVEHNSLITVVTGKGIRKQLSLPDGTQVWLNAESILSYDHDMARKDLRLVFLSGEAFFDVAHFAARPFVVKTAQLSVKVLGTAFNIQAYPKERKSEATLLRGSIELAVNGHADQKVILSPSEKFAFVAADSGKRHQKSMINTVSPVHIGKADYIEETSWKDNQLVFHNESLEELRPRLERWYNIRIRFTNPQPRAYRFTGVLTKENITAALTAMQLIRPFTFKCEANDVTIY